MVCRLSFRSSGLFLNSKSVGIHNRDIGFSTDKQIRCGFWAIYSQVVKADHELGKFS